MQKPSPLSSEPSTTDTHLTCSVCFGKLTIGPSVACCAKSHAFDRAREGYFNLLLANQKGSNDPGDDRDSVTARREFLSSGHYDFLTDTLARTVTHHNSTPGVIVDSGCGEGHFLHNLARHLPDSDAYGLDISRSAIRLASRSYSECNWAIANIARRLPIEDKCCRIILSIMAPRNVVEFDRVLRPDGTVIIVLPGEHHLCELTDLLLAQPADQSEKAELLTRSLSPTFDLKSRESIRHEFSADQPALQRLFTMTPLRWKSQKSALSDLAQIDSLNITASFTVMTFGHST